VLVLVGDLRDIEKSKDIKEKRNIAWHEKGKGEA